jgi:hypothetical protein
MSSIPSSPISKAERAELLQAAAEAQSAFWHALNELERAYDPDAEIDQDRDLEMLDIDILDEEMAKQEAQRMIADADLSSGARDWEYSAQFMAEFDPSKTGPGLGE